MTTGNLTDKIASSDPMHLVYEHEVAHMFLSFCSYVCIIKNKKMNLPNIFLCLLQEPDLRKTFMELCDVETEYEVFRLFLRYDPSLHRSKYIKNYLSTSTIVK